MTGQRIGVKFETPTAHDCTKLSKPPTGWKMTTSVSPRPVERLLDSNELRPLLPFLYFAWSDGVLASGEAAAFRAPLLGLPGLSDEARVDLGSWMNPDSPPTAPALARLEDAVRTLALEVSVSNLTDFAAAVAQDESIWTTDAGRIALERAEGGLGVVADEALRHLRQRQAWQPEAPSVPFDVERLQEHLALPYRDLRDDLMKLLATEEFDFPPEMPRAERREKALSCLFILSKKGIGGLAFPAEVGGAGSPGKSIAAFETLAFGDLSVVVKFGVQFGLFGGSIYQLGTGKHHKKYLPPMMAMELPGSYAMTEMGHGSNVREIETITRYDAESGEFVVHTPHAHAGKEWIGNAALHGQLATVFTQLHVGEEDHGVHAILVPIRNNDGSPMPGIRIEDNGAKEGLNGIDNGRIWFDQVRVPRDNLLDRFAQVTADGEYVSGIPSAGRRFFTMLGTLVAGRISIAAASVSAVKSGLTIAIRYSNERRQFGPSGRPEIPILDYATQQRLLLPRLATTYALHYAVRELIDRYDHLILSNRLQEEGGDVEAGAAALKAYASSHCIETLQACRESMGGRGYRADNRLAQLKADTDVFATFEGANVVLLQLVAKSLLTEYKETMGDLKLWGIVRFIADRTTTRVAELNPVIVRKTDPEHLRDPEFHMAAFRYREERLLGSVARRIKHLIDEGLDSFDALNACQNHLVTLAQAHTERLLLESLQNGVARAQSPGLSETLGTLCQLFALSRLEADRGWFLESGYFEPAKSKAIRHQVSDLCSEVREFAVPLVDAFGIPDDVLKAPDGLKARG